MIKAQDIAFALITIVSSVVSVTEMSFLTPRLRGTALLLGCISSLSQHGNMVMKKGKHFSSLIIWILIDDLAKVN